MESNVVNCACGEKDCKSYVAIDDNLLVIVNPLGVRQVSIYLNKENTQGIINLLTKKIIEAKDEN